MFKMVNGIEIKLTEIEIDEVKAREAQHLIDVAEYKATVKYKDERKAEYPITDELIVALWESVVEGDNTAKDEIQIKRLEVKSKYPKPSE